MTILQNKWENNYINNLIGPWEHAPIQTKWVLRLDADEYLLPALIRELSRQECHFLPENISGIVLKSDIISGQMDETGIYPVYYFVCFVMVKRFVNNG